VLDTPTSTLLLTLMEIVGPILLAAALIYGMMQYRKRSRQEVRYSEDATRKLYRDAGRHESQEP
jgi:hypothetical protein